jgi:hypothetical protein
MSNPPPKKKHLTCVACFFTGTSTRACVYHVRQISDKLHILTPEDFVLTPLLFCLYFSQTSSHCFSIFSFHFYSGFLLTPFSVVFYLFCSYYSCLAFTWGKCLARWLLESGQTLRVLHLHHWWIPAGMFHSTMFPNVVSIHSFVLTELDHVYFCFTGVGHHIHPEGADCTEETDGCQSADSGHA